MGTYADIFKSNKYEIKDLVNQSQAWFQRQVLSFGSSRVSPLKLINSSAKRNVATIVPGAMYFFMYDAKTQDDLPYWDMFPLVMPFSKHKNGFTALNFHYLPYALRVKLLDRLMDFKTNKQMDETTKIKYSWKLIAGVSRFKIAEPCVHRYLIDHIQSSIKKIDSKDWGTAMLLPVERFVGASKQRVWTESMK
jgi:hypothetical protein